MASTVQYHPPEHLVSSSGLTAAQLTSQFEAFRGSLRFASSAPELVFERVVANLFAKSSPTRDYAEDTGIDLKQSIEELQDEIRTLQYHLIDMKDELALGRAYQPDLPAHTGPLDSPTVSRSLPIKFKFVLGEYGLGVQADPYNSEDGNYGVGCRWSDLQRQDNRVQFGSYNTVEDQEPGPMGECWESTIKFSPRFAETPEVVVWLTGVDMQCERPCHVEVAPVGVWEESFDIYITPSEGNVLYSVGVSWVAFPSGQTSYSISRFDTLVYGACQELEVHTHGSSTPEKTLLAVSKYVRGCGGTTPFILKQTYPARKDYICWDVKTTKASTAMCQFGIVFIGCSKAAKA